MPISAREPLLRVRGLRAGYGKIGILHDVNLEVRPGEVVGLLGPNGAGKTTLVCALTGLLPWTVGEVRFAGQDLRGATPRATARAGLVHVIEGHRVFGQLSVAQNMMLAAYDVPKPQRRQRVEEAFAFFPEIAAKRHDRGGALSGGQQQMLVVAQGLVKRPKLLILDEPSAGLSPVLVNRVLSVVDDLRRAGTAVLLIEQLVDKALSVADRIYALAQGHVVLEADAAMPDLPAQLERSYFGKAASAPV